MSEEETQVAFSFAWTNRTPYVRWHAPLEDFDRWVAVAELYNIAPLSSVNLYGSFHTFRRTELPGLIGACRRLQALLNDPKLTCFVPQFAAIVDEFLSDTHDPRARLLITYGDPLEWM